MKKPLLSLSLCTLMLNCLCGCIPVLVGAGVVAGYSLTSDSAIGEIKSDYRSLWDSANNALENSRAQIIVSNESKGIIKSVVNGTKVSVRINAISRESQKLIVSARKCYLPKPQTAQKIFFQITEGL